jgi:regulator of sigma E protease
MPQNGDVHKMSEEKAHPHPRLKTLLVLLVLTAILIFTIQKPSTALNILLVMLGFGAVIMIHEFGHFIVAKLCGIKVEAFSIGFPPTLIALQKIKGRIHTRILPKTPLEETQDDGTEETADTWDTEYRIGLIPFGGFVKMLGQADTGAAEKTDDPRSFTNKPIIARIAVVAAGVIFNAISAILLFMILFSIGLELSPAVVGEIIPNSPAEVAGIRPGDRIIEINGEDFVDFSSISLAAALSGKGEPIHFIVQREDDTTTEMDIVAKNPITDPNGIRAIGVRPASTLTVEPSIAKDPNFTEKLYAATGLRPGDKAITFNGRSVNTGYELEELIKNTLMPEVIMTVLRTWPNNQQEQLVDVKVPLVLNYCNESFTDLYDLTHIHSMVPRLKITEVYTKAKTKNIMQRFLVWFKKKFLNDKKGTRPANEILQSGDIIIKVGNIEYPTFKELRLITEEHSKKEMEITVLRTDETGEEKELNIKVTPRPEPRTDQVTVGFVVTPDVDSAVIAKTINHDSGPAALAIPPGATIAAVDSEKVESFYDIIRIIRKNRGQQISIDYRLDNDGGNVGLVIPQTNDYIHATSHLAVNIPFSILREKEAFTAENPLEAVQMGFKKTYMFIAQTYVTLRRLITREVPAESLMGPVGIVSISYKIAGQNVMDYLYFLGLISSCIAVMNLLPLPIVDGGIIVLLILEKIMGRPLSHRAQEIISYIGLAFILSLFLWLTYNDILRLIFPG